MDEPTNEVLLEKAANIKLIVFDVDGVLTDGKLYIGENGNEYKAFHVRDGHGIVMLMETGCNVAVITARSSNIVAERMSSLGIKYVYQGKKHPNKKKHPTEIKNTQPKIKKNIHRVARLPLGGPYLQIAQFCN